MSVMKQILVCVMIGMETRMTMKASIFIQPGSC